VRCICRHRVVCLVWGQQFHVLQSHGSELHDLVHRFDRVHVKSQKSRDILCITMISYTNPKLHHHHSRRHAHPIYAPSNNQHTQVLPPLPTTTPSSQIKAYSLNPDLRAGTYDDYPDYNTRTPISSASTPETSWKAVEPTSRPSCPATKCGSPMRNNQFQLVDSRSLELKSWSLNRVDVDDGVGSVGCADVVSLCGDDGDDGVEGKRLCEGKRAVRGILFFTVGRLWSRSRN
jgi:hypothetical protein